MSCDSDHYSSEEELEYNLVSQKMYDFKTFSQSPYKNREVGVIGEYVNILVMNKSLENFPKTKDIRRRYSIRNNIFKEKRKLSFSQKLKNFFKIK